MQIPSRCRCKSTHTRRFHRSFSPIVTTRRPHPRFCESCVHGVDMRVLGLPPAPRCDKCSFVSAMAKVPRYKATESNACFNGLSWPAPLENLILQLTRVHGFVVVSQLAGSSRFFQIQSRDNKRTMECPFRHDIEDYP